MLITTENGLTKNLSRASPHLSCSPIYQRTRQQPGKKNAPKSVPVFRFHVCKLAYLLKFILNSKSLLLALLWSFIAMHRVVKHRVTYHACSQLRWSEVTLCLFSLSHCEQASFRSPFNAMFFACLSLFAGDFTFATAPQQG